MCHYLSGHKDIVFCWVPSHIGIQDNERADVLAKAALDKTKQFYYIPYTNFKYNISVYLDDILQGEWNINVTSKLFEVQPIIKRSFTPMERRRDDVVFPSPVFIFFFLLVVKQPISAVGNDRLPLLFSSILSFTCIYILLPSSGEAAHLSSWQ